ncbi:hypothetical protein [Xanthomonas sacchari]|uniref:hypothetical protein n=1 Tax=Xanthomonas sacchari TaxID=56458 RepID=UPI002256B6B9|nr:hypothetical protein [Xanthomonas sacchari]
MPDSTAIFEVFHMTRSFPGGAFLPAVQAIPHYANRNRPLLTNNQSIHTCDVAHAYFCGRIPANTPHRLAQVWPQVTRDSRRPSGIAGVSGVDLIAVSMPHIAGMSSRCSRAFYCWRFRVRHSQVMPNAAVDGERVASWGNPSRRRPACVERDHDRVVSEMAITDVTGSVQSLGPMRPDRAANV